MVQIVEKFYHSCMDGFILKGKVDVWYTGGIRR